MNMNHYNQEKQIHLERLMMREDGILMNQKNVIVAIQYAVRRENGPTAL